MKRSLIIIAALSAVAIAGCQKAGAAEHKQICDAHDHCYSPSNDASIRVFRPARHTRLQERREHRESRHASLDYSMVVEPLRAKVAEILQACKTKVVSAYRPGARIAGSGHLSQHARKRAVDVAGDPSCTYAHLKGWPGGYSTDYGSVGHVHISYDPNGHEWGLRFAHHHHSRHHRRYAYHRHHRRS